MDPIDPSVLSPSKARQAASQARDWAFIMSWLKSKYSPNPVPQFERNEDTLKVLLNLAAANDAADEEEELLHRARLETIQSFKSREWNRSDPSIELVDGIEASLDHQGSTLLEDLAQASVVLGALNPTVTDLGCGIADLTREEFDVAENIRRLETMQAYLGQELECLNAQVQDLCDEELYDIPADLPVQTDEWLRGAKLLSAKVKEYHNRLASLQRIPEPKGPRIEELVAEEKNVIKLRERVKGLESRLRMFHGLPPNVKEARLQHERLSGEYRELVQKRDYLFEDMVKKGL
ncbi:hypothetical protein VTO42DRAFT_7530 [Malbranchea cinnamomea]